MSGASVARIEIERSRRSPVAVENIVKCYEGTRIIVVASPSQEQSTGFVDIHSNAVGSTLSA